MRIKSFEMSKEMPIGGIAPQDINRELAAYAKAQLAQAIRYGEGSSRYDKWVNGIAGADESTVQVPGDILYEFHWWNEIIEFSLQSLVDHSPVKSGRYRQSWFAMVNEKETVDYSGIPIKAEVMITNDQPYSRKIEVGFMQMSVPPGVVETVRSIVNGRFGNTVEAKTRMITLRNGYVLKGHFRKGIRQYSRTALRKDTRAGAHMTYPTLVLTMRP